MLGLAFILRLDETQEAEEAKAILLKRPLEVRNFPKGRDDKGRPYGDLRRSRLKNFAPAETLAMVDEHVLPFLRTGLGTQTANGTPGSGLSASTMGGTKGPGPRPIVPTFR